MKQKFFSIIFLLPVLIWLTGCGVQSAPPSGASVVQPQAVEVKPAQVSGEGTSTPAATPQGEAEIKEETMPAGPASPGPAEVGLQQLVNQAKEDLAQRLNIDMGEIQVLEVKEVIWPDASLGCPQPGVAYSQAPQDGLLIRLGVEGRMYFYHSGETEEPFLCEGTSLVVPKATPKYDEFVPPPDSEID